MLSEMDRRPCTVPGRLRRDRPSPSLPHTTMASPPTLRHRAPSLHEAFHGLLCSESSTSSGGTNLQAPACLWGRVQVRPVGRWTSPQRPAPAASSLTSELCRSGRSCGGSARWGLLCWIDSFVLMMGVPFLMDGVHPRLPVVDRYRLLSWRLALTATTTRCVDAGMGR